jgi:hypothetical protein
VGYYADGARGSPHNGALLVDDDGEWFVNYLDSARLDEDPNILPYYERLVRRHRRQVRRQIRKYKNVRRVLEKYIWVGRYHNFVCRYLYKSRTDLRIPERLLKHSFVRLHEELART